MRWRVLVVRPWVQPVDGIVTAIRKVGIACTHEVVDTRPALVAALEREEWDVIVYDPQTRGEVPIELLYTHAPASAIVVATSEDDMADELARLAAARADLDV